MKNNQSFKVGQQVTIIKDPKTGTVHDEFVTYYESKKNYDGVHGTITTVYKLNYLPETVEVRPDGADYCIDVHINCVKSD